MARRSRREGPDFFGDRKREKKASRKKQAALWIVEIVIVLFLAAASVYFFGMRTSVVGVSMSPTLESGDQILVNRVSYSLFDPQPNDVIVFLPNGNEKSHYYVKRVIGVPGDTVQIKDGSVFVNGERFEEEIDADAIETAGIAGEKITVGEDEYFVLGDNRGSSEDSRYANIGNVKQEYIVGKAWFVLSPSERRGRL